MVSRAVVRVWRRRGVVGPGHHGNIQSPRDSAWVLEFVREWMGSEVPRIL